jgi:ABC-type branched-subunit amino acid transport system permease subunit
MLIHKEHLGPAMMTAALPFGLIGGAILGALSGWIVLRYYRNDTIGSVDAVS